MRQGKVYYKDQLAGMISETDEGEYLFEYDSTYVTKHPKEFITFTMPVREKPYTGDRLFPIFDGLIPEGWSTVHGWVLSPAYDLLNVAILIPTDTEELALTLDGKKKKLKREHFEKLGKTMGLTDKQTDGVFRRMINNKPSAIQWIDKSFLSDAMKADYRKLLESRYMQLKLS